VYGFHWPPPFPIFLPIRRATDPQLYVIGLRPSPPSFSAAFPLRGGLGAAACSPPSRFHFFIVPSISVQRSGRLPTIPFFPPPPPASPSPPSKLIDNSPRWSFTPHVYLFFSPLFYQNSSLFPFLEIDRTLSFLAQGCLTRDAGPPLSSPLSSFCLGEYVFDTPFSFPSPLLDWEFTLSCLSSIIEVDLNYGPSFSFAPYYRVSDRELNPPPLPLFPLRLRWRSTPDVTIPTRPSSLFPKD